MDEKKEETRKHLEGKDGRRAEVCGPNMQETDFIFHQIMDFPKTYTGMVSIKKKKKIQPQSQGM